MRKLFALLAATTLACGFTLTTGGPASATGGWLGCRISPGTVMSWSQFCNNSASASWYNAGFLVQDAPTPLSYTWHVPAGYSIYTQCGSTDHACGVVTHTGDSITVSVTLNYSDSSVSYSATASIDPWCGNEPC